MKGYMEMLTGGADFASFEIFDRDRRILENSMKWDAMSEGRTCESYYDTEESDLEKKGMILQKDRSGEETLITFFDGRGGVVHSRDEDIFRIHEETADMDMTALKRRAGSAFRSEMKDEGRGLLILSDEIMRGGHHGRITYIAGDGEDPREILKKIMDEHGIKIQGDLLRHERIMSLRKEEHQKETERYREEMYRCLCRVREGYETGDFSGLFSHIAEGCVKTSQWSLEDSCGYDEVCGYFRKKGELISRSGTFPCLAEVVELVKEPVRPGRGNTVHLMYRGGKLCLYMEQVIDGQKNGMIVDLVLDERYMIREYNICMPGLFRFRRYRGDVKEKNRRTVL